MISKKKSSLLQSWKQDASFSTPSIVLHFNLGYQGQEKEGRNEVTTRNEEAD
jgi:hypothetical protein